MPVPGLASMNVESPAWHPDNETIIFAVENSDWSDTDLWTVRRDGTNLQRLTNTATEREDYPSYSADGSKIVYTVEDEEAYANGYGSLGITDANGQNRQEL